jgi:hypothetical protein
VERGKRDQGLLIYAFNFRALHHIRSIPFKITSIPPYANNSNFDTCFASQATLQFLQIHCLKVDHNLRIPSRIFPAPKLNINIVLIRSSLRSWAFRQLGESLLPLSLTLLSPPCPNRGGSHTFWLGPTAIWARGGGGGGF